MVFVGATAYLTLSKKQLSPDQPQTNSQNIQTVSNEVTSSDAKALISVARFYLQQSDQQIHLFAVQKDGTIALDTGIPVTPQDKSIADLNIDWKWFTNHNPDHVIDAWQPPYLPGITNYRPNNRYVVQWQYDKYTVTVKIDKNLQAQSTEISPIKI